MFLPSTPVIYRRTLRFSPNVKIVSDVVQLGAVVEESQEFTAERPHVVAEGEGESQVEWVFTETPPVYLVGVYHLTLIARTSARVACYADLALAATRREKWFGLIPYRAEIPPYIATIPLSGS